jgi:Skp family chaperone for outer membrane proteins
MMMRRNVLTTAAACSALILPARAILAQGGSPCAKTGFAFVASQAILASIPEYLQADSLVAKDKSAYMLEIQKLKSSLDSESQAYSDKSTLLNATQKAAEIKKLQAKGDAYQQRGNELEQKLAARSEELLQPIRLRVQQILDGMRAEMNCAVIFDVSGGAGGLGIASADKSFDLTDKVIERLKASAPAKPPAKPPAGKP